jgi:hypothetical protein
MPRRAVPELEEMCEVLSIQQYAGLWSAVTLCTDKAS